MSSSTSPRALPRQTDHQDPWAGPLGRAAHRATQVLLLLALFTVVVYALIQVRLVIIPLLLALILASAIGPFVSWLRRRGWSSSLATAASFAILLALIGGLLAGVVFAIMGQTDTLTSSAVQGVDQLIDFVENGPIPVDDGQLQAARDAAADFATSSAAGTTALAGLSAATNFLTGLVLMIVILFFFLKDGEKIWAFTLRAFKGTRLVRARNVGDQSVAVLGGYVRGTAIVAAVDAFFIGLALVILGVPLALPLAAIVFIGAFIPLVGATLAGAVATLVALVTNGPVTALIVLGVVVLVNQLEGNFLQPVVMGHTLSVHPLVILVALTAGTVLAGIIGAILSVPLTAVAWAGIKAWNADRDEDITDKAITQAETHTLMDEQGHGPRNTPTSNPAEENPRQDSRRRSGQASGKDEQQDDGKGQAEHARVSAHTSDLGDRIPVDSRQETLDAADADTDRDSDPGAEPGR
ncbi:AI-2E family transporter [Arthrobacter sp. SX1312]|uniref:AI-2E family transporter n=1 Tax=Arthrobacter sp. SX1312 TaxID=2058896 RepID=UPI000CE44BC3|nr:AI-2E family transporter [Arthrobacter sp. SX1312]